MRRTHWTTIVMTVAGSGALSGLGLSAWKRIGHSLPAIPWMVIVVIVAMAVGLIIVGWPVGQLTRQAREESERRAEGRKPSGQKPKYIEPLRAARIFVLAKAATITGGLFTGWYGASLVILLTGPLLQAHVAQLWPTIAAMGAAILLLVAGVIVEWFCELPPSDDPDAELAQ